jgi:hypothetical protein
VDFTGESLGEGGHRLTTWARSWAYGRVSNCRRATPKRGFLRLRCSTTPGGDVACPMLQASAGVRSRLAVSSSALELSGHPTFDDLPLPDRPRKKRAEQHWKMLEVPWLGVAAGPLLFADPLHRGLTRSTFYSPMFSWTLLPQPI